MTQIKRRQNEDSALNVQYAARYYFNKAEIFNYFAWFFCLLSLFSMIIPQTAPHAIMYGFPLLVDTLAALMVWLFNKYVTLGAQLRAVFDDYVFGFSNELSMSQLFKEYVVKAVEKHPTQVEIQKKNTGQDMPPGIRDWYNTNSKKIGIDAIFSCQKENIWWDKKLVLRKILLYAFLMIIYITIFLIFKFIGHISVFQIIFSSALLLRTVERIFENVKCFCVGNKLDGQIELLESHKTKKQLIQLQSTLNEKRNLKITGVNFIHKALANKLTSIYNKTKI